MVDLSVKITVLLENTKPENSAFEIEHGLALLVETTHSTFVFDCGHTGLAWKNAALMNLDLSKVQFVVLSHSHYDHAGGFPALVKYVTPKTLYTGKDFWLEKFSYNADTHNYKYAGCGFNMSDLSNWNVNQIICEDIIKIDDEAYLIGNFVKKYTFETISAKFVIGDDKQADNFNDEVVLALREGDGVAIVTGCAHNGILNIISTVQQRLQLPLPIRRIIGGIHLKGASIDRINRTMTEMKNLGVKRLALCHCSGDEVYKYLEKVGVKDYRISTGSLINFSEV